MIKFKCLLGAGLLSVCIASNAQDSTLQTAPVSYTKMSGLLTRSKIEKAEYPGLGFKVGTINFRFGAAFQMDAIHDFKEMTSDNAFQSYSIPDPQSTVNNTKLSIGQSDFAFSGNGQLNSGRTFEFLLDVDLFAFSGKNNPRLRYCWFKIGNWGFGQYLSNFMDADIWPNLMDFGSPNSLFFQNQPQIRFSKTYKKVNFAFSVEEPGSDIKLLPNSTLVIRKPYPDITSSVKISLGKSESYVRLGGLLHLMSVQSDQGLSTSVGAGLNLTGNFSTFGNNKLKLQYGYSKGCAKYINDISGNGYDAKEVLLSVGKLKLNTFENYFLFYDHWWSSKFSTTVGYGFLETKNISTKEDYYSSFYSALNFIYYPNDFMKLAIEGLYGGRKFGQSDEKDNTRIQLSAFLKL